MMQPYNSKLPKFFVSIFNNDFRRNFILIMNISFEEKLKIEQISALDQNSYMPFMRNEFSKIFEDLFTMTKFTEMTHIYDLTKK